MMKMLMMMNYCRDLQERGERRSSPWRSLCGQPEEGWSWLLSGDDDDDNEDDDDDYGDDDTDDYGDNYDEDDDGADDGDDEMIQHMN